MVLDAYRSTGERYIVPIAKRFIGVKPNTLTWISLPFAFLAGLCFYFAVSYTTPSNLFPGKVSHPLLGWGALFVLISAGFDAIDGKVARLTGKVSVRGDFLDHAIDRYADIFIIGGIILSPYCNNVIGLLAIIAVLLTSYMGTQAQALCAGRDYSGLLARADRLIILMVAPLVQIIAHYFYSSGEIPFPLFNLTINLTVFEIVMIWFIIAGNFSAIQRGINIWKALDESKSTKSSKISK